MLQKFALMSLLESALFWQHAFTPFDHRRIDYNQLTFLVPAEWTAKFYRNFETHGERAGSAKNEAENHSDCFPLFVCTSAVSL